MIRKIASKSLVESVSLHEILYEIIPAKTKRPPGNRATSSFSRENSSNGGNNPVKTFCA
jgi:hypothetical protein